jgi:hypothetical protein
VPSINLSCFAFQLAVVFFYGSKRTRAPKPTREAGEAKPPRAQAPAKRAPAAKPAAAPAAAPQPSNPARIFIGKIDPATEGTLSDHAERFPSKP